MARQSPLIRFFKKIQPKGDCLEWTGGVHEKENPYGIMKVKGRRTYAHRFAYLNLIGKIPKGMYVLHKCDNPRCVRPSHLFLGTHKENIADMVKKSRHMFGEKHYKAKLTWAKVDEIRKMRIEGITQKAIAEKFGVSRSAIQAVVEHKTWQTPRK